MKLKVECYEIEDVDRIHSPGLVIFRDLLDHNLGEMIRIAGGAQRLRPHCKTHKIREVIQLQRDAGITRQKCATLAEAEMLANLGVQDILLAYQMVGPNISRFVRLVDKCRGIRFAGLVDSPEAVQELAKAIEGLGGGRTIDLFIDVDPGMKRTGILPGPDAIELYEMILASENLNVGGLHWYDGHHRQPDPVERKSAVLADWERLIRFRDQLMLSGLAVHRIVAGGTGSFPILAQVGEPGLELSPGTITFHDAQMIELFPEMNFRPALAILTRVISNNRQGFLTLDVGHKACAADPPAGKRLAFPGLPDAVEVQHSEEHLVIRTAASAEYRLGDHLIAIPSHACPTSAAFEFADVIAEQRVVGRWKIAARNRELSI